MTFKIFEKKFMNDRENEKNQKEANKKRG